MARQRAHRPPLAPVPDRTTGVRHVLQRTLPGRLIVVGLSVRLALVAYAAATGPLPTFLTVVDTVAGLAIAIAAVYFLYRLFVIAKRRLLWRVRRKLILSYIFIGFVPAILIVSFFLLGGFLLFNNLSSYLVQSRLRALSEEARFLAQSTAFEIQAAGGRDAAALIARKQANAAAQFAGISFAVVPVERSCKGGDEKGSYPFSRVATSGPWAHVDPPTELPSWIPCAGFSGLLAYTHPTSADEQETHFLLRGVGFPDSARPGYAVVVDLLVSDAVAEKLQQETGVRVVHVSAVPNRENAQPLAGRADADAIGAAPANPLRSSPLSSVSLFDYRDWKTGAPGLLSVAIQLSIGEIYDRISGSKGNGVGLSLGQRLLVVLGLIGLLFLVIEFLALVVGLALAKSITGSIHELFTGTQRVRQGDFTHKIPVRSDDQLGELTDSFNTMTASIEDLLLQAAEKKRLEEELRIAHEIQMSLLPQGPLHMRGLSVAALCVPAREVGGDYYDFLPLGEERVGVLIADVSGKGTSAALYMAELKGLVLSLSRIHRSPRDLLIQANRIIAEHLDARSFITMTYAVLDLRARTMTYARAGHTPLIYLPGPAADSRRVRILAPDGLVLGLKIDQGEMFERLLVEQTITLHTGDLYVFFTDGISEAMNEHDDCFGEGRLGALIEEHAHLPSSELRERLLREIEAFVGTAPQHDDMTMILLKVEELAAPIETIDAEPAAIGK